MAELKRPAWEEALMRWLPKVLLGFLAVVIVLSGVAVYTLLEYQPKTACQRDSGGRECQQLKVESDRQRSKNSACVITRRAGLGCPALGQTGPIEKLLAELLAGDRPDEGSDDAAGRDVGDADVVPRPGGGGDTGSGGGADLPTGSPDDPGATDPPSSGDGDDQDDGDSGDGGTGGGTTPPAEAPADQGLIGEIGEAGEELVCDTTGQLGLNPAGVCP